MPSKKSFFAHSCLKVPTLQVTKQRNIKVLFFSFDDGMIRIRTLITDPDPGGKKLTDPMHPDPEQYLD
jgi:hypothetical protein